MDLFGRPDIEKMIAENDREGLYHCLDHHDPLTKLRAAQALTVLQDGAGWRALTDWVMEDNDPDLQEGAAAILSELAEQSPGDAHRAVQALSKALASARGDTAEMIRDALLAIGGEEVEQALAASAYAPTAEEKSADVDDFEAHFVRPVIPDTGDVEFLSAEAHLNNAVDLREAELAERGLVECSLALWLKPDWAYAWYLRGVLFEDLDRPYEAYLAYQRAVELDPHLQEPVDALQDLAQGEYHFPALDEEALTASASSQEWQERRDAAAGLGNLAAAQPERAREYADLLVKLLADPEREVCSAAITALGEVDSPQVIEALTAQKESSWLLRFSIIESLSRLKSVPALVAVLRGEMDEWMERNPSFSRNKDPLAEVEYERLMEISALAFERTGDIATLLEIAEENEWEEVEELDSNEDFIEYPGEPEEGLAEEEEDDLDEEEVEEDLSLYVDEVSQMACLGLDRAAHPRLSELEAFLLDRLSVVPDLTLIDLENEDADEISIAVVCDLSSLREDAKKELARRKGSEL